MNATFTLIADTNEVNNEVVMSYLKNEGVDSVKKQEQQRGIVTGAISVIKFIIGFSGGSEKIAEGLIRLAEQRFAGTSLKVQVGTTVVEVSNVRRKDIVALLDKVAGMSEAAAQL